MYQKNIIKSLAVLTAMIAMATISTNFASANENIITIDSSDVIHSYEYAEFADRYNVFEDADNAIIPITDMPYLAHYENNGQGQFIFQEWLEYEDHASINQFEDKNEY